MSSTRWRLKIVAGVAGVLLMMLAGFNYVRVYCCAPVELTLSGGNVCPLRSEMAQHICSEVRDAGVHLLCARATNSEEVCEAVSRRELDLGLVLGGFAAGQHPDVRQVAALGVDPLHLLVRRELLDGDVVSLELLRGRRVSLGEHGTNGALLAESLVRFANLRPSTADKPGDFTAEHNRECDLHAQLLAIRAASPGDRPALLAQLPEALFIVDSLPSPIVDELVAIAGYQLVPLPYATALHLDSRRDRGHLSRRLEASRLEAIAIPAFTYGLDPAAPATDCPTFGLRLLLVAHKDTPPTAVLRLLRALDGTLAERYHINLDATAQHAEFPLHPGAVAFAQGRRPLMLKEVLEPTGNVLSVLGAGAAGVLGLYGFLRGLRAVNPDVHLRQVDRIERLLRGSEHDDSAPTLPLDFIIYLEARLADVKQAAIEDYAAGRFEADEALVGILTLVADTRHLLVQRRKQLCHQEASAESRPPRLSDAA